MYLPGDKVLLNGTEALVVQAVGHQVTIEGQDGILVCGPEHTFPRVPPSYPQPNNRVEGSGVSISHEDSRKLAACLPMMTLDWNGHHLRGGNWSSTGWYEPEVLRREGLFRAAAWNLLPSLTSKDIQSIVEAHGTGVALGHFVPVCRTTGKEYACPFCAYDSNNHFETNGIVVRPVTGCPQADGLVTEFNLNVPSGKVIIDDDLRYLCRIACERSINTPFGTHLTILDYAANGLALGFGIGNTSPTVARQKGGAYTIGHGQGGRKVASVCTDLWAYSIIDYEEAQRRAVFYDHDLAKATSNWSVNIVKIPKGLYQFRHFHGGDRDAAKVLFATFERVGDALPLGDWCGKEAAFQVHITQAVQHRLARRPAQYATGTPAVDDSAWAEACATTFSQEFRGCIPDRDWHRNGHRNEYLREDIASLPIREIPRIRFRGHWEIDRSVIETTVNRSDNMFGGDIPLNDSYAIAAGRVLESVISFGLNTRHIGDKETPDWKADKNGRVKVPNPRYDEYTVPESRAGMHKAADLWYGLVDRYLCVVESMPDFAAWMEDREAVTRWIDAYDLGPVKYDREAHDQKVAAAAVAYKRARVVTQMQVLGTQVRLIHAPTLVGHIVTCEMPSEDVLCVDFGTGAGRVEVASLELTPEAQAKMEAADAVLFAELMAELHLKT